MSSSCAPTSGPAASTVTEARRSPRLDLSRTSSLTFPWPTTRTFTPPARASPRSAHCPASATTSPRRCCPPLTEPPPCTETDPACRRQDGHVDRHLPCGAHCGGPARSAGRSHRTRPPRRPEPIHAHPAAAAEAAYRAVTCLLYTPHRPVGPCSPYRRPGSPLTVTHPRRSD